jgi:ribosome modulation factor
MRPDPSVPKKDASASWDVVLKSKGRKAGQANYPACVCPVTSDMQKKIWLREWSAGMYEKGHTIPREVKPLLRRLGIVVRRVHSGR